MATTFCDSVSGSNTSPYDTWAKAATSLSDALSTAGNGGIVYVNKAHSENYTGNTTLSSGTISAPTRVICVNDNTTEPPTTLAQMTNFITTNSGINLSISNYQYWYGMKIKPTDFLYLGASTVGCGLRFENCVLTVGSTGSARHLVLRSRNDAESSTYLINTDVGFSHNAQQIDSDSGHYFVWDGGTLLNNQASSICKASDSGSRFVFRNVDLSAVTGTLFTSAALNGASTILLDRCLLNASATISAVPTLNALAIPLIQAHRCTSANDTYEFMEFMDTGTTEDDTTNHLNATDGAQNISIKMTSSTVAVECTKWLVSPPITAWTDKTVSTNYTIELAVDSAVTLRKDDVWVVLESPGSNALGVRTSTKENVLTSINGTPTVLDTSTASWTWPSGTPNKYKITVNVTPGKAGVVTARVYLGRASTVIYVDPVITES